jgi:hypothetical protein
MVLSQSKELINQIKEVVQKNLSNVENNGKRT